MWKKILVILLAILLAYYAGYGIAYYRCNQYTRLLNNTTRIYIDELSKYRSEVERSRSIISEAREQLSANNTTLSEIIGNLRKARAILAQMENL